MFTAGIITVSDKGSKGQREDESGKQIRKILESQNYNVRDYKIIPDEKDLITKEMIYFSDQQKIDLIITTGGTGFSERDVTPEATREVTQKLVPGIPEAIRQYSLTITKKAMLSRSVAGIRNKTLIINLPGSPKAVRESLEYIIDTLTHGLEVLGGSVSECAEKIT